MKWLNRIAKGFRALLLIYAGLVAIDMFILRGAIKRAYIALANTSSMNPMGTDGMINYIVIFVCVGLAVALLKIFERKPIKKDEKKNENNNSLG